MRLILATILLALATPASADPSPKAPTVAEQLAKATADIKARDARIAHMTLEMQALQLQRDKLQAAANDQVAEAMVLQAEAATKK